MAEGINIISRTQNIIVDRGSGSVAIINMGPIGPAGPPGSGVMDWAHPRVIDTISTVAYDVVAGDAGKIKRVAADSTITLPSGAFTTGQIVDFLCVTGKATFVLGIGAAWDVAPTPSNIARAIGSRVTAIKMGPTAWALSGDLEGI